MKTYLIVGLGNLGTRYAKTRHNVGFMVIHRFYEYLFDQDESEVLSTVGAWQFKTKLSAECAECNYEGEKLILSKPTTFMNESGSAVAKLKEHYPTSELIVVHDDLDLAFGKIRVSKNSGHAGHRGVASIIESLGTKDFTRIRLGLGRPPEAVPADEYVLQNFTPTEQKKLPTIIEETVTTITKILTN